jgi:hypothetical protein
MGKIQVLFAVTLCAFLLGCEKPKSPAEALPSVTLVERKPKDGTLMLRFCFKNMDRVDWKKKVLKAQLMKADGSAKPGGPLFKQPVPEFSINLAVGKVAESESVLFVASWGKSTNGLIDESERIELPGPDGQPNLATIPGTADLQITQILYPCTGPNLSVPFDPDRGIDLVRLEPTVRGTDLAKTKPEVRVLRVWAQRVTAAVRTETDNP